MAEVEILMLCTGNICRSPMAAALLAAEFEQRGVGRRSTPGRSTPGRSTPGRSTPGRSTKIRISSAGTMAWSQRPATDHARAVMAERGLDISGHRSREVSSAHLAAATLILVMTREHAGFVLARSPGSANQVFLPAELARLMKQAPADPSEDADDYIWRLGVLRNHSPPARTPTTTPGVTTAPGVVTMGRASEVVADPYGEPLAAYRATANHLARALAVVAEALTGCVS